MGIVGDALNGIGNIVTGGTLNLAEGKGWDPFGYQEVAKGANALAGGGGSSSQQPATNSSFAGGAWPGYPQTQGPGAYPGWPVPGPGQQPSYQFQGDLSKPGAAETFFGNNQGAFTAPTQSGNYWQQNNQRFGAPGQGDQFWNQAQGMFNAQKPGSNDAEQAYQQFQTSAPANTDPFYQHALTTALNSAKSTAASQGLLGSSGTQQQMNDLTANILGQQALANANYGLQRGQTAGQLGSAADLSSRGINQNQLGWMQGLGSLGLGVQNADLSSLLGGAQVAGNADQLGLAQLMAGMNSANAAQQALQNRGQQYFNNQNQLGMEQSGILGNTYGNLLNNDNQLFSDQMQAMLGLPREQLNQSLNGRASTEQGIGNLFGLLGGSGGSKGMLGAFG